MRTILIIGGGLLLISVILYIFFVRGGLFGVSAPSATAIDIESIKPAEWTVYGNGLQDINIDDDSESEWMLLYSYAPQALGGVIYDSQNQPFGYEGLPAPNQSPTFLIPYRLFPDYVDGKATDYLGEDSVEWKQIFLSADRGQGKGTGDPHDRLQVRGTYQSRVDRFSAFWWLGPQRGYGGTAASTSGWFSLSHDTPSVWDAWDADQPITALWAWEPLADRSNLCRRVPWVFPDGNTLDPQSQFAVIQGDNDYFFCAGSAPSNPAYPEGQVVAYLHDWNKSRFLPFDNLNPPTFPGARVRRLTVCEQIVVDGKLRANGEVDITADDGAHALWWGAQMEPPKDIEDTVHWLLIALVPRGQEHCNAQFVTD